MRVGAEEVVELELEEVVVVELEVGVVELDVVVEWADPPEEVDEPEEPVPEMTGVPLGREPLEEGTVTTTVPLPVLTTGVPEPEPVEPEPVDPEPEPVEPEPLPEPVETGVVGVAETGVGVLTTGTVTVPALPPEPLSPEPVLPEPPLPEPPLPLPLPEPVLVGVELRVGARPATGWEMVAEVECCAEPWAAVPWLAWASRVLRLLATDAGTPAAPTCALTTLTDAIPWDAWAEPGLGCAVSVCVAGEPIPPSLGHPL